MSQITVGKNGSLNPCCSGQWSSTCLYRLCYYQYGKVLILVVVDNGLAHDVLDDIYSDMQS